ncbi:hypothetical protein [Sphingobacterium sp. SYP-B4668]|uniref:hypothetical protein n=1 Tax=Sphingobacterium sp. SYP-B4668 TaxID=2996035 RepID=UPI0022DE4CA0|nr:hypothetical protein [Sphingobacterium sp. SYP-B4668]
MSYFTAIQYTHSHISSRTTQEDCSQHEHDIAVDCGICHLIGASRVLVPVSLAFDFTPFAQAYVFRFGQAALVDCLVGYHGLKSNKDPPHTLFI